MRKFKFTVGVGFVGAVHEDFFTLDDFGLTEEGWRSMTEKERDQFLQEEWNGWTWNYLDGGWSEVAPALPFAEKK